MLFQKQPATKPNDLHNWISAITSMLGAALAAITIVVNLGSRLTMLEAKSNEISNDLKRIEVSIEKSTASQYPRSEAVIKDELFTTKIQTISDRLSQLEKQP
jgi:hypothetical protein